MISIAENLTGVRQRIAEACRRAGRAPESVRLIAVSKTKPTADILSAYRCGQLDFGENYVQEIAEKADQLPSDARIHMIGHLQTNKVSKVIRRVCLIHSVDSIKLIDVIERNTANAGLPTTEILLEVNAAKEETKYGFRAEEVLPAVRHIAESCPHVRVKGLMTSAPLTDHPEENRCYFAELRELELAVNAAIREDTDGFFEKAQMRPLAELSMGMSGDYLIAIEEGATMVRVGTAIFGARDYTKQA